MWRLGVPAGLMLTFALVGLTTAPWRETAAPTPGKLVTAVVAATPPRSIPVAATPGVTSDTTEAVDERAEPGREIAAEPGPPVLRLPEELGPEAPDVVVAMELPSVDAPPPMVSADADVAESTDELVPVPMALAAAAGDDFQGPEPGARYWFGPRGLERVEVLGEGPR